MRPIYMASTRTHLIRVLLTLAFLAGASSLQDSISVTTDALPHRARLNAHVSLHDTCPPFIKYSVDGFLHACHYKLHIFQTATLHLQHTSLPSLLDIDHLAALDQHALHSHNFDIWSIANIFFAFEPSSRKLFTAWGPDLQLRLINSSDDLRLFENIHPNHPSYDHHCAPFCTAIRPRHTAKLDRSNYHVRLPSSMGWSGYSQYDQNSSNLLTHNYSPLSSDNQFPSSMRLFDLTGCENCTFGTSTLSCADLVRTCLNNEFSCSAPYVLQNDSSSLFCMGLYHMYLNPETAFCPLEPTHTHILMYGICDKIYDKLIEVIDKDDFTLMAYELSTSSDAVRQLATSVRAPNGPVRVTVWAKGNNWQIMNVAIDDAIDNNMFGEIHRENVNTKTTLKSVKCGVRNRKQYQSFCTVVISFDGISR